MDIRHANDKDIPAIVDLLKESLGEALLPKSEEYWRWKHMLNPFGQSPVLIASDNDKTVGVRAFMCWEWSCGHRKFRAVRAVDTATHPAYQGKGIFKKLTLQLLEECRENGTDFVFNTPNEKSKPGYLKMGWKTIGRFPISIQVRRPFAIAKNMLIKKKSLEEINADGSIQYFLDHPQLETLLRHCEKDLSLRTAHTVASLKWRYQTVPGITYFASGVKGASLPGFFLYRMKSSRAGTELRITDVFCESSKVLPELRQLVKSAAKLHSAHYITMEGISGNKLLSGLSFLNVNFGPSVTVFNIAGDQEQLTRFPQWKPSTGDLELF